MLKNYAKLALKHLLANKLFSLVNILGLAGGLACCLLVALYLRHELGYDSHFANAERILSVETLEERDGQTFRNAWTTLATAELLERVFSEIEVATRRVTQSAFFVVNERNFSAAVSLVDPNFVQVFDFEWLEGSPQGALDDANSLVLSRSLAQRFFGEEPALGRVVEAQRYGPRQSFRVTGVVDDQPRNTSVPFEALAPLASMAAFLPASFSSEEARRTTPVAHTYLLLEARARLELDAETLDRLARDLLPQEPPRQLNVFPFRSTHFHAFDNGFPRSMTGQPLRLAAFAAIGVLVLLIAVINFMNLSTVKALGRAKEVGLRKACGASRGQLVGQYLGEALLQAILALGLALAMVELLLPVAEGLFGVPLELDLLKRPATLPLVLLFTALVGMAAGVYPALVLSSFAAARVLKGELTRGKRGAQLRGALVVLQFSAAVALLVSALTVSAQMHHARGLDLGFTKDEVLLADLPRDESVELSGRWPAWRERLLAHPGIREATHANITALLSTGLMHGDVGREDDDRRVRMLQAHVESHYFAVHDIPLLAGRLLSENLALDRRPPVGGDVPPRFAPVLLNATAARLLGWTPQEAVGKFLGSSRGGRGAEIVGVVGDTLNSARNPAPAIRYSLTDDSSYTSLPGQLALRLSEDHPDAAVNHLAVTWEEFMPGRELHWRFLNEDLQRVYAQELRQMRFFNGAAAVGLLIACLGLHALAALSTQQRAQEISVRKVLGGKLFGIVLLLTLRFSGLVLLANLLAWPLAWFAMQRWLAAFTYRIELGLPLFLLAALLSLVIAWLTVGGSAVKAGMVRPARVLRHD